MASSHSSSTTPPLDLSIPFHVLGNITNGFSEIQILGRGGYGVVYKGVLNGEDVAVKKLYQMWGFDDKQFKNEFNNLMKVAHQNIVRLVGYCYEDKYINVEHKGEFVFSRVEERALCFEYLPGSLDKHLYDEFSGHDWRTRYKVIKGICDGLNYLHGGLAEPMYHLDLKPGNILLDKNMVPKIADLGLSRLFTGTQSRITDVCKGTVNYMPPEYMEKRVISKKFDVFSLGIIIIQTITGPGGFSKYGEVSSPEQFVELVHKNWSGRIEEATPVHAEVDCQQLRRCIEIALNCVEADRAKRPTIKDIVHELEQTETMIGPWGGDAGWSHGMEMEVSPRRMDSVIIWCGEAVDALAFSYTDLNGKKHILGPWGGPGGKAHTIQLGPSEFLTEVSGTTGPFGQETDVVKSLTLVTNAATYGPFGKEVGARFHTSMRGDRCISAFFVRAGLLIYAIGVYVNQNRDTIERESMEGGRVEDEDDALKLTPTAFYPLSDFFVRELISQEALAKVGPWGGNEGINFDMKLVPHRLESLTICSGDVINSIAFTYSDITGKQHTVGPWGGDGGSAHTIQLGANKYLNGIYGTIDSYEKLPNVITSLWFATNLEKHGTFGKGGGTKFYAGLRFMLGETGSIVGFFGRAGSYVEALGVYIRKYSF